MAQSLEVQASYGRQFPTPMPSGAYRGQSPAPPPPPLMQQSSYTSTDYSRPISTYPDFAGQGYTSPPPFNPALQSPYNTSINSLLNGPPQQPPALPSLAASFSQMNISEPYPPPPPTLVPPQRDYDVTAPAVFRPELIPFAPIIPRPSPGQPPILIASLPTVDSLSAAAVSVAGQDNPARKIAWSRQVLNLVDRTLNLEQALNPPSNPDTDAPSISNPKLLTLTDQAISQIIAICDTAVAPYAPHVAEAFYLRGSLAASGLFPQYVPRDLRSSFKDYEAAARNGYHVGWFKIGRDYEGVQDSRRAKDSFERGVRLGEKNCLYVSQRHLLSITTKLIHFFLYRGWAWAICKVNWTFRETQSLRSLYLNNRPIMRTSKPLRLRMYSE